MQKAETEPRVGAAQVGFQEAFKDIGGVEGKKICECVLFSTHLYIFVSGKARLKAVLRVCSQLGRCSLGVSRFCPLK